MEGGRFNVQLNGNVAVAHTLIEQFACLSLLPVFACQSWTADIGSVIAQFACKAWSVRHFEIAGLVERRPDPADRRRLLIAITPGAQDLVRRFVPEVVALQASVMQDIPEEDRRQFVAVLSRIREAIAAASP